MNVTLTSFGNTCNIDYAFGDFKCSRIKHYNEKIRKYIGLLHDGAKISGYLIHFRKKATEWRNRHSTYRQIWERETLTEKNIQLILQYGRLRGPQGKLLVASSGGTSTVPVQTVGTNVYEERLSNTLAHVPVRPERTRKYVRIEWSPKETLTFIKIMLEESPKFYDENGKSKRSGFYKYIEDTYVTHKKLLHEDRNSFTLRCYWGDLCRTIRDPKYREAAVALYELDKESLQKIMDIPAFQVPSKGRRYEEYRIKAVVRKYREMNPPGPGEADTSKEAGERTKRQRAPPRRLNL